MSRPFLVHKLLGPNPPHSKDALLKYQPAHLLSLYAPPPPPAPSSSWVCLPTAGLRLFANSFTESSDKIQAARKWGIRIVHWWWLVDTLTQWRCA